MLVRELRRRINRFLIPSIALSLTLYFVYSLFYGSRGLVALKELETKAGEYRSNLNALRERHDQLAHKVRLLRPESLCPDLLEERAKAVLGFTHADEKVILDAAKPEKPKAAK